MSESRELETELLEPKYHFVLNPYPDVRLSRCPRCGGKTRQRKLPLFIHIEPNFPLVLNYTCRYCEDCDTLYGHRDKIEHILTEMFRPNNAWVVGNKYVIAGTVERKAWKEGMDEPKHPREMLAHTHPFKSYSELRMSQGGWFPEGVEPPTREPPAPEEWTKDP